jgi:hypothetical protein
VDAGAVRERAQVKAQQRARELVALSPDGEGLVQVSGGGPWPAPQGGDLGGDQDEALELWFLLCRRGPPGLDRADADAAAAEQREREREESGAARHESSFEMNALLCV